MLVCFINHKLSKKKVATQKSCHSKPHKAHLFEKTIMWLQPLPHRNCKSVVLCLTLQVLWPPIFLPCYKTGGSVINTIQDGPFWSCSRMGGDPPPLPKICHVYPIMTKLSTVISYLKQIQKIYESRDTPLEWLL